ncbi:hypothetical protein DFH06DRAFT_1314897 [Mycena polygramma]|nr:hypothetical protein DFH06DRAFT_1314897 [Mycena polygramma]
MNSPISLSRGSASTPPLPSSTPAVSPTKTDQSIPDTYYDDAYENDSDTEDTLGKFAIQDRLPKKYKKEDLTIRDLHSLIHEGMIDLNPPYQRGVVWPLAKQALLIDSLFRDFYIPPVLFAVMEDDDGVPTRVCVDGKQYPTVLLHPSLKAPLNAMEYTDLPASLEREIFMRVQMGMSLTTAEKLAAIDSPWAEWISTLESKHISVEGGLSEVLNWDTSRGREFQNVAHFVYCCDSYPDENVPTAPKMEKWLSRVDPPNEQFKSNIDQALDEFGRIASDPTLSMGFTRVNKRIAPVEFVFIGVLIYILRKATPMERAQAIYHLRTDIREEFLDIRFNGKVGAGLWRLIRHLKESPTTSITGAPTPSKRKRRISQESDEDYHPSPIRSIGKNPTTRSRRD